MAAYKRLNLDQRIRIQTLLESRTSFKKIADDLKVHPSTISREVQLHSVEHNVGGYNSTNRCTMRRTCDKHNLCPAHSKLCQNKRCSSCRKLNCNNSCRDYKEYHCPSLDKTPYVCNGCEKKIRYPYRKRMYFADQAETASKAMHSEFRSGMNLTEEEVMLRKH